MSGWEIFVVFSAGLAALLLLIFGGRLLLSGKEGRQKGWLMVAAALVTFANLAIWLTWPAAT